jgi:Phage P22-like portal protein
MEEKEKVTSGEKADKLLKLAKERFEMCVKADQHNRNNAVDDLNFLNGDQWDPKEKMRRKLKNRPALQIPLLGKYINQVKNEIRQNKPRIKIRPINSQGDVNIAKIRGGIIANIEYLSNAETIYDEAARSACECGYGGWRVLTRYREENPFLQEIYYELLPNPLVAYLDPNSKDPTGADAEYGFIYSKMSKESFDEDYPESKTLTEVSEMGKVSNEMWWDKETVGVIEYFLKEYSKVHKALLSDGTVKDYEEAKSEEAKWKKLEEETGTAQKYATIVKDKDVEECKVRWYKITFTDILEEKDWGGRFIPIVMVYGRERNIEGKRYIESMIRQAKDSQKLYNYWYTSMAEFIALAPKNPWLGSAKMFEGYETDYASANIDNVPILKAKHDPNFPGQLPQRQPAPSPPMAIMAAIAESKKNIEDTIGMFKSDVGDVGPERSGAAIRARQKPGDIGTFDIYDNLIRAVKYGGIVSNDMIPVYYDTEQDVPIKNADGSESFVPVNTTAGNALQKMGQDPQKYGGMNLNQLKGQIQKKGLSAHFNHLKEGKYDVVVDTGPSYATQRAEAVDMLIKMAQAEPQLLKVAGDIIVSKMDIEGADEIAERIKKTMPPGLIDPKPGDKPIQPLPPSPQMQVLMAKGKTEEARQQVAVLKAKVELVKLYKEVKESDHNIKQEIIHTLAELHAPNHPADSMIPQLPGGDQGAMPEMQRQ